jgi:hypothetical protein
VPVERLVHFPEAASALGFKDTRAVAKLCKRHGVPVLRLNRRTNATTESGYALLLERVTDMEGSDVA